MALQARINVNASDGGLHSCFSSASVPQEVQDFFVNTLKVTSLVDFVHIVSGATYDTELKAMVETIQGHSPIWIARTRSAYKMASEAMKSTQAKTASMESAQDLDDPLHADTARDLQATFKKEYNLEVDSRLMPSDSLLGRVRREWHRGTPTVVPLHKVKSIIGDRAPMDRKSLPVGAGDIQLVVHEPATENVTSIIDAYWRLRVLTMAWALCGTDEVDSVIKPNTKVKVLTLSHALAYADFVLYSTTEFGSGQLQWLIEKDNLCRGRMVGYMRRGMPAGEALQSALDESKLEWRERSNKRGPPSELPDPGTPTRKAKGSGKSPGGAQRSAPVYSSGKALRTISTLPKGMKVCKPWNDGRGCTNTSCPDTHCCDIILEKTGKPCRSTGHNRLQCKG